MKHKNPILGIVFAFGAAMFFGLNASTSKVIVASGISAGSLVLYRSLASAALAAVVLFFTNRQGFKVSMKELPRLLLFGILGVALMQWSYSNAVAKLPVGIALLVEYTAVIWVPIAAKILWREQTKKRLWLGVALVILGLVAISQIWSGGLDPTGLGFAALAAILLSIFFLMGEHAQQSRDAISTMFYTMLVSTLFWLCFSPWWNFDTSRFGESVSLSGNLQSVSVPFAVLLAWVGLAGSFVPMLLSYAALGQLSATGVGIISTSEVVFAAFFGWLWLGEKLDGLQLLGGGLLIAGIIVAQTARIGRVSNGHY